MLNIPTQERLDRIPRLYQTEHIPLQDKIVHLHFFVGLCDWYIVEYDGEDLFFGYAILNGDYDCAEWGYVSFSEMKAINIDGLKIDCELENLWGMKKVSEIKKIWGRDNYALS